MASAASLAIQIGLIGIGMMGVFQIVRVDRTLRAARAKNAGLAVAEAVAKERLRFARELHARMTPKISAARTRWRLRTSHRPRRGDNRAHHSPLDHPADEQRYAESREHPLLSP